MHRNIVNVSLAVIKRLPKYYRCLGDLMQKDIYKISSKKLANLMGLTASQIRQDLNVFGGFGQQGYGYNVAKLRQEIGNILGLNKEYNCVIVGAGNLGQAIANYEGFKREGFNLKAMFDANPRLVDIQIRGVKVYDIDELANFLSNNKVDIGIICVPKEYSQEIADVLTSSNVKAIWNFAPADIKVPDDVAIENVAMSESLYTLTYYLNEDDLMNKRNVNIS